MTGHPTTPQDATDLLTRLVETQSYSTREAPASALLASWMASRGFEASVDESGSAVGILGRAIPGLPPRDIVLLGHIDTVQGWIPVEIKDGALWGRGSVDAKGSLATFAAAAAGFELPQGVRIVVIGATEEEAASSKGAHHARTQYTPHACIIGEPSGAAAVTIAYKGRLNVTLRASTPGSHSAGPAPTAPELIVTAWNTIQAIAARLAPGATNPFDQVLTRLRSFTSSSDGLTDRAQAQVGIRLPTTVDPHDLERMLRAELANVDLTFDGHEHAHQDDPRSWLARSLTTAIRARGKTPRLLRKTGTSDMNVVARSWSCPIVAYGPGDSALDHTPQERLDLQEYLEAIATLREALREIVLYVAGGDAAAHTIGQASPEPAPPAPAP